MKMLHTILKNKKPDFWNYL